MEGGAGETALDAAILDAYAYWRTLRPSSRAYLPKGTQRQIKRAFGAGYDLDQVKAMMDALLASEWHQARPETLKLSTIFATKPGGKTFEDQLDYWLERAQPGATAVGSLQQARVDNAKAMLRRGATELERAQLVDYLDSQGIRVTWGEDAYGAPVPSFEPIAVS